MLSPHGLVWFLRRKVGNQRTIIKHEDPFKVLISTVLSQRTKDSNTEVASKALFSKYSTPKELSQAPIEEIEGLIRKSGFYQVKARYVKSISEKIVRDFNGVTPDTIEELLSLQGVGRKTANCVLVYGFSKPAIPVDVHVHRISNMLGIVKTETPEETEVELQKFFPEKYWIEVNHLMVKWGQMNRFDRKPLNKEDVLKELKHGSGRLQSKGRNHKE